MAITVAGTNGDDTLNGTNGADTINGSDGNDVINAGQGADARVAGGKGNDTINIDVSVVGADNEVTEVDGDRVIGAGDAFTSDPGAGTGTDTVSINTQLTNAMEFTAFDIGANNATTLDVVLTGNDKNVTVRNVENIEFSNVTIDLDAGDEVVFTSDIAQTSAAGGNVNGGAAFAIDGNVGVINVNNAGAVGVAGDGDIIEAKNAAAWDITHVNGVKLADLTAEGATHVYTKSGDYKVTVSDSGAGAGNIHDQITFAHLTGGTSSLEKTVDTVELTLTNANGETVVQKVVVTDSPTFDGTGNVTGTSGDDTITGTGNNAQTLDGAKGNDVINAGFGNDTVTGGAGNDTLAGQGGTDTAVYTGSVNGITSSSVTSGTEGTDSVSGFEKIMAENLGETVEGVDLNDAEAGISDTLGLDVATKADFFGGQKAIKISAGETAQISLSDIWLKYAAGDKTSAASTDGWTVSKFVINSDANANALADVPAVGKEITVTDKANDNGAGVLTVKSTSLESDVIFEYTAKDSLVTGDAKTSKVIVEVKHDTHGVRHFVLDLTLNGEKDSLTGDDTAESFVTGKGADTVDGKGGNDTIDGGDGDDTLSGGDGDDQLLGADGNDKLTGGDGNDTGNGGDGNDTFSGGKGNDAFYAGADDGGNDNYDGEEGDDTLGGGEGDDTLDGGEGSNLIFGGDDEDVIITSSGDDSLEGDSIAWAGEGDDSVTGGSKADMIGGGTGDDTINSNDGNDTIFGGANGRDNIDGGKGDDLIFGGAERDTVKGGAGNDEIYGGDDADEIDGGDGNDLLYGGAGNDEITAGKGLDTLDGGAGNDVLTAGNNKDTFVFEEGDGVDTIKSFNKDEDVLDFSAISGLSTDILQIASETKQGGTDGVLIDFGGNNSVFIEGLDLGEIRDADIKFAE